MRVPRSFESQNPSLAQLHLLQTVVDVGKVAGRNDGLVESVNCHVTKRTATKRASGTAGESKHIPLSELNTSPTSVDLLSSFRVDPALGRGTLSVYTTYAIRRLESDERWDKQVIFFDHRKAKQVCEPVPRKGIRRCT